jgi:hypothetical protein
MIHSKELCLDSGVSRLIFNRSGKVVRIEATLDIVLLQGV